MKQVKVILAGGLNTDIIGAGVEEFVGPGELTLGGRLVIGPGGKSRNMAQMAAAILGRGAVAMVGRTSRDPYSLWRVPLAALRKAGVNTRYVKATAFGRAGKFPGVALIPVDGRGRNQIYVLPGVNADFSPRDIDAAARLLEQAGRAGGVFALSLELPLATAAHGIRTAVKHNLRVVLDPGGIDRKTDYRSILNERVFVIKPNEYEAEILTGIKVRDFTTARMAAARLRRRGISNVMITHGAHGAYLFTETAARHLPVPKVRDTGCHDETGCGDQVTAMLAGGLADGRSMEAAAEDAVLAGALQFMRIGIVPVTRRDLVAARRTPHPDE